MLYYFVTFILSSFALVYLFIHRPSDLLSFHLSCYLFFLIPLSISLFSITPPYQTGDISKRGRYFLASYSDVSDTKLHISSSSRQPCPFLLSWCNPSYFTVVMTLGKSTNWRLPNKTGRELELVGSGDCHSARSHPTCEHQSQEH